MSAFVQEIIAGVVVLAAVLYLIERLFGVAERLGLRKKKGAPVQLSSRLQRGLKNARRS